MLSELPLEISIEVIREQLFEPLCEDGRFDEDHELMVRHWRTVRQ
jgi:hypothetical protein